MIWRDHPKLKEGLVKLLSLAAPFVVGLIIFFVFNFLLFELAISSITIAPPSPEPYEPVFRLDAIWIAVLVAVLVTVLTACCYVFKMPVGKEGQK